MDARENPQAQLLVREMLKDVRAWRLKVQEAFQGLSRGPTTTPVDVFRERLTARLEHLEARIEETLNKAAKGERSDKDGENFYRLRGAYRGLSEAAIEYVATSESIEWGRWRESRF